MKKFNKILKGSVFISLLTLMTSCAIEEVGQKNVTQSTTDAKIWFDTHKNHYSATILDYANDFEWQNAIVSNGELGEIIEVPFTLTGKLSTSNKDADLYNDHHRLMFIKGENNEFKLFDVQIFTNDEKSKILDKNYNYYNIKDNFDGKVFVQELGTKVVSKLEFKNDTKIKLSLTSKQREAYIDCVAIGYWYEDGHFEPIGILYCEGGGGDSGEPSPSGGYGGGGGTSGSGSGTTGLTTFQKIQKNITSDKLDACTKAILAKLRNLKQGDIAAMIARFSPSGSIFNMDMSTGQVKNNDPNILAQTTKVIGSSTDISIIFNQDYISGNGNASPPTDLSVVTTMAHEVIHAYLISQLEQFKSCGDPGIVCDFPTVYDAYVESIIAKDTKESIVPARHHELIANDYVNAIASTIEEFQTGQPVTSGFPRQVYLDMAWGGLDKTTVFNTMYPNDPNHKNYQDRLRILSRITTERLGSQYGVNTPIGTPCKK